jgi:hypothetical protein
MLNCGHSRSTAQVARVEGDAADRRVERYDCFGPKCLAGIGSRADTVRSRAVVIPLSRAADGETVQELEIADADTRAALYAIRDRMTAWAAQSLPMLHTAKPDMSGMGGRMRDNWRPLLAIADLCGYGAEARAAAIELAKAAAEIATDDGERSLSVQLLRCIRDVFESGKYAGHEHITTVELLHELCGDDEQPWCTWRRGEPMGPRALVKLLRPFAIQPVQIGAQRARSRGYRRAQFVSAWRRYT